MPIAKFELTNGRKSKFPRAKFELTYCGSRKDVNDRSVSTTKGNIARINRKVMDARKDLHDNNKEMKAKLEVLENDIESMQK